MKHKPCLNKITKDFQTEKKTLRYLLSNHFYHTSCRLVSFFRRLKKTTSLVFFLLGAFRRFSHCPILFITCTNDLISSSSLSIRRASLLCWSVLFSLILSFEKYFVRMKQSNSYLHYDILYYIEDQIIIFFFCLFLSNDKKQTK